MRFFSRKFKLTKPPAPGDRRLPDAAACRLPVEDIELLWRMGEVSQYAPGVVIVAEKEQPPRAFLVFEGVVNSVAAVGTKRYTLASHAPGQWFGAAPSEETWMPAVAAVAAAPTRALALDAARWQSLPARLQAVVAARLAAAHGAADRLLLDAVSDLSAKNRQLALLLERSAGPTKEDYVRCDIVRSILDSIPRLPIFAAQLIPLLKDTDASTREIVALVSQDPSLVAETLKVVNSAQYGFDSEVSDIHHAIMLLGFNQVHKLVIATGLRRVMPAEPEFDALRDRSRVLSQMVYELAKASRQEEAAMLSTCGLLHNIGLSVILLLKRRNPAFELLIGLLDHPKLAALLLERWNLPPALCLTIEWQRHPEFAPPADLPESCRRHVATLYAAGLCIEALRGGRQERFSGLYVDDYLDLLGLNSRTLGVLAEQTLRPAMRKRLPGWQTMLG